MAKLLDSAAVADALDTLTDWTGDPSMITRTAELPDFPAAIHAVERVAGIAEQLDHHPDIDIRWRSVTFRCSTHSAGGVTDLDITLARQIDEVVAAAGHDGN